MITNRIGIALKRIREQAGLGQKDISVRMKVDQSRISRIENGAEPSPEEIAAWLKGCPGSSANELQSFLDTEWPPDLRPSWDHPDIVSLRGAVTAMASIERALPGMVDILCSQLFLYRIGLAENAAYLATRTHRVAFLGPVGVGKTTAEAIASGLVMPTPSGKPNIKDVVLAVGAGRTTVCEVIIEEGERWGILIEPETDENIKFYVDDLCSPFVKNPVEADDVHMSVPQEVARSLRNMADLAKRQEKNGTKIIHIDPIKDLAAIRGSETATEFLLRLKLPERSITELWWTEELGGSALDWLRTTFKRVNNGNHDGVNLPKRIHVIIGRKVLEDDDFHVSLIDTRGVDKTVKRPDLAACLNDSRTATILCSSFVNAPDAYTNQLLQFAQETGITGTNNRVSILVLAKNDEASQVHREADNEPVESDEEGYAIKESQMRLALQNTQPNIAVDFFNSANDDSKKLRSIIKSAIHAVRQPARNRIIELTEAANEILSNPEAATIRAAQTKVIGWLNRTLQKELEPGEQREEPYQQIINAISESHPQAVWAMARRRGRWLNLDVSFHIGSSAASDALKRNDSTVERFTVVIQALRANEELQPATKLIDEVERAFEQVRLVLVVEIRNLAVSTYGTAIVSDLALWAKCDREMGKGSGFRDRVAEHIKDWFRNSQRDTLHALYKDAYSKIWKNTFTREIGRRIFNSTGDV